MSLKGAVVLVEDDKEDREITVTALRKLGVTNEVVCFENGRKALDYLLEGNVPFIILCDIDMPVMNGFQLRMAITQNDELRRRSIPFVFLAGHATKENVELAYEMTVQGFFAKSHSFEELTVQLAMIFNYWKICLHPQK